jgi:hypothetical protein
LKSTEKSAAPGDSLDSLRPVMIIHDKMNGPGPKTL